MTQKTIYLGETTFFKDDKVVLQINNLSKIFNSAGERIIALRNVSFSIKEGEFISIIGPSGCGKSTLLNMLDALDRPTRGSVSVGGINLNSLNDSKIARLRNSKIGFIFQSFNLINRSSVQSNVELPTIILGMNKSSRRQRSTKLLKTLGILDKTNQKPQNEWGATTTSSNCKSVD